MIPAQFVGRHIFFHPRSNRISSGGELVDIDPHRAMWWMVRQTWMVCQFMTLSAHTKRRQSNGVWWSWRSIPSIQYWPTHKKVVSKKVSLKIKKIEKVLSLGTA